MDPQSLMCNKGSSVTGLSWAIVPSPGKRAFQEGGSHYPRATWTSTSLFAFAHCNAMHRTFPQFLSPLPAPRACAHPQQTSNSPPPVTDTREFSCPISNAATHHLPLCAGFSTANITTAGHEYLTTVGYICSIGRASLRNCTGHV